MILTLEIPKVECVCAVGVKATLDGEVIKNLSRIDTLDAEVIDKSKNKMTFRGDFEVVEENGERVLKVVNK